MSESRFQHVRDSLEEGLKRCRGVAACIDDARSTIAEMFESGYESDPLEAVRDGLNLSLELNSAQAVRLQVALKTLDIAERQENGNDAA